MNGHTEEGMTAYGPEDEDEWTDAERAAGRLAAIMEQQDSGGGWRMGAWSPSPLCPVCGWELLPVEDGRMVCPDCGHEEGGQ